MAKRKERNLILKGFAGGSASSDHAQCLRVLDEFVSDIEEAYGLPGGMVDAGIKKDLPFLFTTYQKARKLVRDD